MSDPIAYGWYCGEGPAAQPKHNRGEGEGQGEGGGVVASLAGRYAQQLTLGLAHGGGVAHWSTPARAWWQRRRAGRSNGGGGINGHGSDGKLHQPVTVPLRRGI